MSFSGEALMRPMWNEFPQFSNLYDVNTQYMVGSNILFAPKLTEPN